MADFSKVSWIGPHDKPGTAEPHLLVIYENKWYLVPHRQGGWKNRERYTPAPNEVASVQTQIASHEPSRDLWDDVTSGLAADDD